MSASRSDLLFMAQIAEQAERWDDMREYMSRVAKVAQELDTVERNMLSQAFKESVNARRLALREVRRSLDVLPRVVEYHGKLQEELTECCEGMLEILPELTGKASDADVEGKVFYLKLMGDYCRYLAEFGTPDESASAVEQAKGAYSQAMALATSGLGDCHPGRLGLALNYAVFQNEVLKDRGSAIALAKETLADLAAPAGLDDENAAVVIDIKQILEENLKLWQAGSNDDGTQIEEM
eukprot:CAMPEP_0176079322 /NCGR_PEP_ID=MMETSP0120_2-20121206/39672_1 /TAXON_ID=160619 /ORGANISM="Kryptoperidinium foliaceum, Strain CCMP 1326" /LENGTH=237 /DNA_ID=CAMNT_0017413077 /DNA_START=58 /DNA_END=771 /DNA_ORIENTATION=-